MIVEQSQMYYQFRKRFVARLALCVLGLFSACQNIPADNPYDPRAPEVTQAPSVITGELLTSEARGDLRGASVYLFGRSSSTLVECLSANGEPQESDEGSCERAKFTLTDVPPGTYQIGLQKECYGGEPLTTVQVGIGETINLSERGGEGEGTRAIIARYARGIVSGAVEGPPRRFMDRVRITDGRGAVTNPDEDGNFRLEMAACRGQVFATLGGFLSASSAELDIPVNDELQLEEPLTLTLEPIPAILVGRLSPVEGSLPAEGVSLTLTSASPERSEDIFETTIVGEEIELEELKTGPWVLRLSHPSFQTVERRVELEPATRGALDAYDLGTIRLFPATGELRGK